MILSITDLIIFILGGLIIAAFLYFYMSGQQYAELFENLSEDEYRFKDLYFVGYAVMEKIHYEYKSKGDRKIRKDVATLYGEKYADYYLRVVYAQRVTLAFLIAGFAVPFYAFSDEIIIMVFMFGVAGLVYYYYGTLPKTLIEERSARMLNDFSDVVSKLALLTNAGMIIKEAWMEVAYTRDTEIYKEMQTSIEEMNNGISEVDAIYHFGNRCVIPEVKKFTSTIIQGMEKGNSELAMMLQNQSSEVWNMKQQLVRRQGEQANTKLVFPMMIMFIGILIMIMVPIFMNLGV